MSIGKICQKYTKEYLWSHATQSFLTWLRAEARDLECFRASEQLCDMKTSRREFFKHAGLSAGALALLNQTAAGQVMEPSPGKRPTMRVGLVTYNLAADWDIETLIQNCEATGFEGVELRTTHAHKVELGLAKAERQEVKNRFKDSKVQLVGLGSIFEYHTTDQAKLRADIEATKQYIILSKDVGAQGVKVRPNALPANVTKEKTLEQIGKSLHELAAFAQDHGQILRLEVHGTGTSLVPNIKTILDVAAHKNVGAVWNCNPTDLEGDGWDKNFSLIKDHINLVHMHDLFVAEYPYRKLLARLQEMDYNGFCLAEIDASKDPIRVMKYYKALWLAYQNSV